MERERIPSAGTNIESKKFETTKKYVSESVIKIIILYR